jgi:hypothetical protein
MDAARRGRVAADLLADRLGVAVMIHAGFDEATLQAAGTLEAIVPRQTTASPIRTLVSKRFSR